MNVGIIGLGYWGPNIVRNFATSARTERLVGADPRPERREFIKKAYPLVEVTAHTEALLDDPEIDAVAVVTPVDTHYELARRALENGKHVLVEKPLTATSDQARELIRLAEERQRTLMVDHTFVYTSAVRRIRELIRNGDIGEIRYYDSVRVNLGLFQHDINVIWDLAPHDLSIMDYLLEEKPVSVQALGAVTEGSPLEYIGYLTLRFPSGLIAHFHANWLSPVKIRQTLIGGTRKMIVYNDNEPSEKVKVYDKGIEVTSPEGVYRQLVQYRSGDMWAPQIANSEALQMVVNHFLDCARTGATPETDGRAGLAVVRILEASTESLRRDGALVNLQ
jgi:predicted dehydrogenase